MHNIYIDNMTEQELHEYFPGLSLMDFRLLCNIAYHGEIPGSYMISNFASRAKVSADKVNETIARLRNTGYLWNFAKKVCEEDWKGAADLQKPCAGRGNPDTDNEEGLNMERYIGELVIDDDKSPFLGALSDMELSHLAEHLLEDRMLENTISLDFIDKVRRMMHREGIHSAESEDVLCAYKYFVEGNCCGTAACKSVYRAGSVWSLGTKAIDFLYRGYLRESLECFTLAMRGPGNAGRSTGPFNSRILSFFYAVCLLRCSRSNLFAEREIKQQLK